MSEGKTLDERLEALVQSVELLARMHKDNEARMVRNDERMTRLHRGMLRAMEAYLHEVGDDGGGPEGE
ncbi:MAG: hypothetical protein ACRD9L_10810 [Bryobacteraceae bacterium]